MQGQLKKFYRRMYRPLIVPSDRSKPIRQASVREPFGAMMSGIERTKIVNGRPVTVVLLQDGTEEPLSDLAVTEMVERRKNPRPLT